MKFTDGFWHVRPGVDAQYAQEAYDIEAEDYRRLVVSAPTKTIERRGDTLNRSLLTVTLSTPLDGVIGVRIENHRGDTPHRGFELVGAVEGLGAAKADDDGGVLTAGGLTARISRGAPWDLTFEADGRTLTSSGHKSVGRMGLAPDAPVTTEPAGCRRLRPRRDGRRRRRTSTPSSPSASANSCTGSGSASVRS